MKTAQTPSQHVRIIRMLKKNYSSGVPNYVFPRLGILDYTARISELRQDGWKIVANRSFDSNGKATNTFIYKLIED